MNGSEPIGAAEVGLFDRAGDAHRASTARRTRRRCCSRGEPIDEPIVGHGPVRHEHAAEIRQAMIDYQSGRMGHLG